MLSPNFCAYAALDVLYATFLVICCVQIGRIVKNGHRLISFQSGFLALGAVWMCLRLAYFSANLADYGTAWFIDLVYYLPLNVEFGTFSLLALFYASTIQRHRDKSRWESSLRRGYYWAYGALNLLLLCADAAWVAWSLVSSGEAGLSARSSQIRALISAGVFTVLAGILVLFAAQIGALLSRYPNMRLPFQAKSTSNGDMIALTALLAFLFVSRCVYNYLAAFGIVSVSMTAQGTARSALVIFFLFFAWEIAPTALVVVMTLHIPSAKRLQYEARNPYAHRAPRYGPINVDATVSVRSPLFANPNRYESDDDAPAQIPASPALYGAPGQYRR